MKIFLGFIVVAIIAFITVLPMYLGPDDIQDCERPSDETSCRRTDAIVVVSGGDTNARTDEGIRLYEDGWADLLIFSGAAADPDGPSNAEAMRQRALEDGVPSDAIVIEELSRTTSENAANTSLFIERRAISRVMLVTSTYHQRRASLEFQNYLGDSVTIVNRPVASDRQWQAFWWLRPESVYLAMSEIVKIAIFYVREAT